MSTLTKDRIIYDSADIADSDKIFTTLIDTANNAVGTTDVSGTRGLDVNVLNDLSVDLDHSEDSVRLGDGTNLVTVTNVGADYGLDVNLINASIEVTATDLDIRDLSNATDSIAIGDASNILTVVAEDAAAAGSEYGFMPFGIRQDAAGSPVSADGDYHPFVFNDDGELKVAADLTSSVADDAADSGNPIKVGGVAYSQASALSALSADGDRGNLAMDLYRRLWVNKSAGVGIKATNETVGSTAAEIASSPLAGRQQVFIQNNSNKSVYLGEDSAVTTSSGMEIGKGDTMVLDVSEAIDIYLIGEEAGQDVRILEVA